MAKHVRKPARRQSRPRTRSAARRAAPAGRGKPRRQRAAPAASDQRRQAILEAALHVFSERGFAAARLEDVAARAGIAKGTLYLYFSNKQALFEDLIRSYVAPVLDRIEVGAQSSTSVHATLLQLFELFRREVLGTERKKIIQLLISEGPRFPAIAEFYYREVVSRGMRLFSRLAGEASKTGALRSDALARFPQLIVAPIIVAVVWDSLFSRLEPLDVEGMLKAHAELLTGSRRAAP